LTSLKSEVAPMVPLEEFEYQPLEERTDRSLPESVDLSLQDLDLNDDFDYFSRPVDQIWARHWRSVGFELIDTIGTQGWSHHLKGFKTASIGRNFSFDFSRKRNYALDKLEDAERSWRMSRPVDSYFASQWRLVGLDITSKIGSSWSTWLSGLKNSFVNTSIDLIDSAKEAVTELKEVAADLVTPTPVERFYYNYSLPLDYSRMQLYATLNLLEEKERAWRINRTIDALWLQRWNRVQLELTSTYGKLGTWSAWFTSLKSKFITPTGFKADFVAPKSLGFDRGTDLYSYQRGSTAYVIALEEAERSWRMSRGVNAVIFGKWHRIGLELKFNYFGSHSWFAWLRNLESSFVESAKEQYASLQVKPAYIAPRDIASDYFQPELVDFTFMSYRTPYEIINLEETERNYRIQRGVNPILYGLWFRLGLELKYKYSLRPTLASTANTLVRVASDTVTGLAEKAGEMFETIAFEAREIASEARDLIGSTTLTATRESLVKSDFIEHGDLPLNYFAFTAEPIDFTFSRRRCPPEIIAMEESERIYRMNKGVDAVLYGKWNAILSAPTSLSLRPIPIVAKKVLPFVTQAKDTLVEKTSEIVDMASGIVHDVKQSSWTGYFGTLAHSMADKTHHLVDIAKESVGIVDPASIAAINKAEEAERLRRMNEKVDPMLTARLNRVQDELLRSVKSV